MDFRNKKLSIGIIYVGIIVVLSFLGLFYNIGSIVSTVDSKVFITLGIYYFFYLLLTLPLDFVFSNELNNEKDHSIKKIFLFNFLLFIIFYTSGVLLYFVLINNSFIYLIIYSLIMQILLLIIQNLVMRFFFIKNQKEYSGLEVLELKDSPKYMTSNIIYGVFSKCILIPEHWLLENTENYNFHLKRIFIMCKNKIFIKVLLVSAFLNTIVLTTAIYIAKDYYIDNIELIINLSLLFNLVCFIYILLLPKLSQWGVMNIDNIMKKDNIEIYKKNLEIFEKNQDKNNQINQNIESIFYPIPSVNTRIKNQKNFSLTFPNISRTIIFMMMFGASIILKGVHGNAGKPENWIFPPTE